MKKYSKSGIALALGVICAIMYYFLVMTPYMTDNYVFSHYIRPGYAQFYAGAKITTEPLTMENSFRQACEMYYTWCGRFTGNLAVYLLFMLPRWLYCIVAAAAFGFYTLLLGMCVFGRQWRARLSPGWLLAIAALVWICVPSFGEAFLWLSVGGQIALLGQTLILLPFRFALDGEKEAAPGFPLATQCVFLFAGGMAVSSLDFATSAALPVTAFCCCAWLYFRQKRGQRKIPWALLCASAGLALGAAITILAPGNAQRMLTTTDPTVHAYLAASWGERIISWFAHLPLAIWHQIASLFLICWGCFGLWLRNGRKWWQYVPIPAFLFLLPAMLTHGAYLFTAWPPPRAFATTSMQLLVCGLVLVVAAAAEGSATFSRQFRFLKVALGLFCALSISVQAIKFYNVNYFAREREEILLNSKGNAVIPPMPETGNRYFALGSYLLDIAPDPDFWVNRAMAAHYGLNSVKKMDPQTGVFRIAPVDYGIAEKNLDAISVKIANDRIYVKIDRPDAASLDTLHIYYPGIPGLIYQLLPDGISRGLYNFLCAHGQEKWIRPLCAIMLARTDISLRKGANGELTGKSMILKLRKVNKLWLVAPGEGRHSLDLLPMEKI